MKNKKTLYFILMFLPLIITLVVLPFLPEQIPAHYNFAGEIDRWGSKYESLIFPFVTIAMGFFMLWMAKISSKRCERTSLVLSFYRTLYRTLVKHFSMVGV